MNLGSQFVNNQDLRMLVERALESVSEEKKSELISRGSEFFPSSLGEGLEVRPQEELLFLGVLEKMKDGSLEELLQSSSEIPEAQESSTVLMGA